MGKDLITNLDEVVAIVRGRRTGMFFDIDGTLSPLVGTSDPAAAIISPRLRNALRDLSRITYVALLTGRCVADAYLIINLDGVTYSGNHGTEWYRDGKPWVVPEAEQYIAGIHQVAMDAWIALADISGLSIEDKGLSLSMHYRLADDKSAAELAIDTFISNHPVAQGLRRSAGKLVTELRPPIEINKGTVVESLVTEFELGTVVMFGDDTTDVDAFITVQALRETGLVAGVTVGVLSPDTPDVVRATVDYTLADTDATEELVVRLVEELV